MAVMSTVALIKFSQAKNAHPKAGIVLNMIKLRSTTKDISALLQSSLLLLLLVLNIALHQPQESRVLLPSLLLNEPVVLATITFFEVMSLDIFYFNPNR